jgi:TATA-box binding protein (TBP) (component of TFIID and TFIIIB)
MEIQNCTASFRLFADPSVRFTDAQFHLMARWGWNTEWNPRRFHAIIMRIRHQQQQQHDNNGPPRGGGGRTTAALIFASGKVVLTGVPHPRLADRMANEVAHRLRCSRNWARRHSPQHGSNIPARPGVHQLRVTNLVGVHRHPQRLAIERMYEHLRRRWQQQQQQQQQNTGQHRRPRYDPTIFPALRFKLVDGSTTATCLCYISGRVIVTGVRTEEALDRIFHNHLLPLLNQFPRRPIPPPS